MTFSQIKKKELTGEWYSDNDFGQYYKNDTIQFTSRVGNINEEKRDCEQIKWDIENRAFKLTEVKICTARVKATNDFPTRKIKFRKTDFGQLIEYHQEKNLVKKFRILELNKNDKFELKLMRFDKLNEEKLYNYIDTLIVYVFKYNPNPNPTKIEMETILKLLQGNPKGEIRIRDGEDFNPEPLIVVKNHPIENREILKKLLFVETYKITLLTVEKATIYSADAINGAIVIQTSEKRFKNVRKKYGR